jgi:hypothetical protein
MPQRLSGSSLQWTMAGTIELSRREDRRGGKLQAVGVRDVVATERGGSHHAGRHTQSSGLGYSIFGSLYGASLDDLPSRLRLEYCRLLCERIDALARFCGGLLDDDEFGEAGHKEGSRFLEFFVAYFGERLDDALNRD